MTRATPPATNLKLSLLAPTFEPHSYNATLTTSVDAGGTGRTGGMGGGGSKRHTEHLKSLAKVNPKVLACIEELCQVSVP